MTREIKFRVWDKDNNKMLHYDNDIVPCLTLNGVLQDCSKEVSSNVSYKYELMQYTGLRDKNGVEIYEGDIIEFEYFHNNELSIVKEEVVFSMGQFSIYGDPLRDYNHNCIVVGNIYADKELLNE